MKSNITKLFFLVCFFLCSIITLTCKKLDKSMLVKTGEVTNITTNSADASGEVIDIGAGATQRGHCYGTSPNLTTDGLKTLLGAPTGPGSFTSQLKDLEAGKKYYVKAYLQNGAEIVYGEEKNFTTNSPSVPTLTTTSITSITVTSAASGGNITSDGGASVTARGVCWNTSTAPKITNNKTSDDSGTGSYSSNLTGLTGNTTYFVRAYATNSTGTAYGNELTFTTTQSLPAGSTTNATSVTNTTATLNGTVNANNLLTTVTFDYGLTTSYGMTATAVQSPVSGTTSTSVSANISGLKSGQIYHYKVKCSSTAGTTSGSDITFTTTVKDNDDNVYNTVTIGTQVWMKEDLRATKYSDGSSIPLVTDTDEWINLTSPAYCWYDNDKEGIDAKYGALYNWYTVNTGKLCPQGWHVPSYEEFKTLSEFLGGDDIAGGKLKETGTNHWLAPNTGATNESGFTALPGGDRDTYGEFWYLGEVGGWWSSTLYTTAGTAYLMGLYSDDGILHREWWYHYAGLNVRCVRD